MSTCPDCETVYHGAPGDGCPNCFRGEAVTVQECECGAVTVYLCPECSELCCQSCIAKSEWSACKVCTARLEREEQRRLAREEYGEGLGDAIFDLAATAARAQNAAFRGGL